MGAIETIMASQAQISVAAFIDFCVRRCANGAPGMEGGMDGSGLASNLGSLPRLSGGDADAEGSEGEAAFYEAAESLAAFSGTVHFRDSFWSTLKSCNGARARAGCLRRA